MPLAGDDWTGLRRRGLNVQVAVDTRHHHARGCQLGTGRSQLAHVAKETKATLGRQVWMSSPIGDYSVWPLALEVIRIFIRFGAGDAR